jgi:hypothetical protein
MSRAERRRKLQGNFPLASALLQVTAEIAPTVGQAILRRANRYLSHSGEFNKSGSQVTKWWKRTHGEREWKIDSAAPHQYGECLKCRRWLTADDDDHEFCHLCNVPPAPEVGHELCRDEQYIEDLTFSSDSSDFDDDVEVSI